MTSLRIDEARRIEPPTRYRTVEINTLYGKTRREIGGRIVCRWRGFWIIKPGKTPVRIIHSWPRKERKF